METFGHKLREVMASRDMGSDDLARETGLEIAHVEALCRDDFAALPEDERVTQALEVVARLVDVSPDEVIGDFLRQREEASRPEVEAAEIQTALDAPAPDVVPAPRDVEPVRVPAGRLAMGVLGLLALALLTMWILSPAPPGGEQVAPGVTPPTAAGSEAAPAGNADEGASRLTDASQPDPAALPEAPAPAPLAAAPAASPEQEQPAPGPAQATGGVAIPAFGTGASVIDHELIAAADRFIEGDRVWFWTRVEGADAGAVIQHVWIHGGQEVLSVPLRIGGPRWRTQSYKTMHPGSGGPWVVEARGPDGRVLARQEFACVAP